MASQTAARFKQILAVRFVALLLRREKDATGESRLQPYAHLGTGNYHPRTARTYTDFGLLTAHPEICADVQEVFLHITSLAKANRLKRLWLAPFTMHRHLLEAIRRETRHAREGKRARIVAKMNALLEEAVIKALYAASQAGVSIDLIVRGACALRPGVKGVSDNIRVRSIVGRFLEHSRIWWFDNNGADDVYLSSADWMGRNLFRRIEVAFPVLDPALKGRVIDEGLKPYLGDSRDAWELGADASYARVKPRPRTQASSAQAELLERMADKLEADRLHAFVLHPDGRPPVATRMYSAVNVRFLFLRWIVCASSNSARS